MNLLLDANVKIPISLDYDPFNKYETGPDKPYLNLDGFVLKENNGKYKFSEDYLGLNMYPYQYSTFTEGCIELSFICTTDYCLTNFEYKYILKYSKNTINKLLKIKIKSAFKIDKFDLDIKLGDGYIHLNEIDPKHFDSPNEVISFAINNTLLYNMAILNKSCDAFDNIIGKFKNEIKLINKINNKKFIGVPCIYLIPKRNSEKYSQILIKVLFKKHLVYTSQILDTKFCRTLDGKFREYCLLDTYASYEFTIDALLNSTVLCKTNFDFEKSDIQNILINFKKGICISDYGTIIFQTDDYYSAQTIITMANDLKIHIKNLIPDKFTEKKDIDKYLISLAKKDNIEMDTSMVTPGIYTWDELDDIYYNYKSDYIYNKLNFGNDAKPIKKVSQYDSMKEINNLIGLDEVKKLLKDILSYNKMQSIFSNRGISKEEPCKHMVFYGNPGTAKTTVARLFGKILKENNVLTKDIFKEVSRNDLISEYLGGTASKTHMVINEAKGGILFIDEAYSLNDKWYGNECIDTLVQELDNIRKDTIVIFAGYPDKMNKFFDANPGLKSRIAFHVNFPNYSKEELLEISKLIAKSKNMALSDEALIGIGKQIDLHINDKDFGNGRFIRNIIEQSMMKQSTRIVSGNSSYEKIKDDELMKLEESDIVQVQQLDIKEKDNNYYEKNIL